jgi:hypothetical protein
MIEVLILAAVVALLATVLVLYRRNSRPAKSGAGHAATAPSAASYYSDVGTLPAATAMGGGSFGGPADPFAGFGGASQFGGTPAAAPPPPPPPPAPATPSMPPPGTPASWMPDPGGAPDTLRYWDGMSWTQHVAKRN